MESDSYVGKYCKKRLLGRGTFGEAWLVVSRGSGRSYVMKEIATGTWEAKEKDTSMNEVNILNSCNHVNIIRCVMDRLLLDVLNGFVLHRYAGAYIVQKGLASERILIIMEFANAGDLAIVIKKQREEVKKFFSEADVLSWFVQIAFGLQYIHKKHILHRDLKTQNIFVTSQKLIKIGDFGISKSLSHTLDLATTAIGTPHYLSPEICRRQPYNHKSDIWSLGCVLYELCALQLAFPADNFVTLVQSICRGAHRPIPGHYSSKMTDLVQVVQQPWSSLTRPARCC
jgi:NIMA (never in mitosis gene a)-related kinase